MLKLLTKLFCCGIVCVSCVRANPVPENTNNCISLVKEHLVRLLLEKQANNIENLEFLQLVLSMEIETGQALPHGRIENLRLCVKKSEQALLIRQKKNATIQRYIEQQEGNWTHQSLYNFMHLFLKKHQRLKIKYPQTKLIRRCLSFLPDDASMKKIKNCTNGGSDNL